MGNCIGLKMRYSLVLDLLWLGRSTISPVCTQMTLRMGLSGRFSAPRLPKIAISIFFAFQPQLYAIQGLVIDVMLASLQNSDSDLPHSCPGLPEADTGDGRRSRADQQLAEKTLARAVGWVV